MLKDQAVSYCMETNNGATEDKQWYQIVVAAATGTSMEGMWIKLVKKKLVKDGLCYSLEKRSIVVDHMGIKGFSLSLLRSVRA